MITFLKKNFHDLTLEELYAVLKLRMTIFMLEQQSLYLDIDDQDQQAIHVLGLDANQQLVCYARINVNQATAHIRRVCVIEAYRSQGLGSQLMQEILQYLSKLSINKIALDAQFHLQNFYGKYGFVCTGDPYDDGGVLHITMQKFQKRGA
ncbi:MAG: GNAT family N-acetyltransferase [Gammaproteobacteria bacterium]